tara:strand:- start:260 stop:664 length:405 start_codon:yes stop_codon:yes gene_type:complete
MMLRLNFIINLLNLFLILIFFIFLNKDLLNKEFEYLLIFLIIINLLIKLYNWYNFSFSKKQYLNIIINNIFFSDRFLKFSIIIFSIVTPVYMILQKDSLVIDMFIEKLSFLLVFIFSILGFYLEFFILESKTDK